MTDPEPAAHLPGAAMYSLPWPVPTMTPAQRRHRSTAGELRVVVLADAGPASRTRDSLPSAAGHFTAV
ncbi:MAG: hypothetical protein ACRDPY_49670, partial [Streptosporangiaceae bacterium]